MTVTVICLAHNHEAYIREALEGFVQQRTDFPFEVLVHDDASTDGTADIIREYAGRFPDIIRPVYETENRHSRGVCIARDILFPMVRGRYVALCEGDDCWTDPMKLSRQVTAMEAHPELDICAHRAVKIRNGRPCGHVGPGCRMRVIPVERVILGGGGFVATSSIMCRREAYLQDTPMRRELFLDYTLQVQGSLRGGMLYLGDCMSIYRRGVAGSWTDTFIRRGETEHYGWLKRMLDTLDAWTDGRYSGAICRQKRRYDIHKFFRKLL